MKEKEHLKLRNLVASDKNTLFAWRNHHDIRKNFFNMDLISLDEHEKWFKAKSKDPNTTNYLAHCGENKIGLIRFEVKDDVIIASVMLNPDFLGKGYGAKVIRLGTEKFVTEKKPDKSIIAEIKKDNVASIKAFQKAGFRERSITYMFDLENIYKNAL